MQFLTKSGDNAENVFYVKRTVAWDLTHVVSILEGFITWFNDGDGGGHSYRALTDSHTSLVEVSGRDMTTDNGISVATSLTLPLAGTDASGTQPPGLTFAMTARTGLAGRSFRGRTFLVAIGADFYADATIGQVSATAVASAQDAFNSLMPTIAGIDADSSLVVASFFGGAPTVNGKSQPRLTALLTPITGYGFHDLSQDFQRRRSPFHHRHH